MAEKAEQDYHWFTSSFLNWRVDESLTKCLTRQRLADTKRDATYKATCCSVWKVPLPIKAHYRINDYEPQVEGREFITREHWSKK